jgi:hypothetical protein
MAQGLFTLRQQVQGIVQRAWNTTVNPLKTPAVDYLVVAGGGGSTYIGGAGAGGLLQGAIPVTAGSPITVTVGSGGTSSGAVPTNGNNSIFGNIVAVGGGKYGSDGGSGGGNGQNYLGGQGTAGQGNAGAPGTWKDSGGTGEDGGGGGGGAGTAGLKGIPDVIGGNGGAGIASSISGTVTVYSGGGAGCLQNGTNGGTGGVGGGGNGVSSTTGAVNTGGGAGAPGPSGNASGGSGIVIISYPDIYAAAASTTGSPTVSTSGSGSIALNGSSYIKYAGQTPFAFGTGDFTIEMWLYLSVLGTFLVPIDFRPNLNGAYPNIYKGTDNRLYYYTNTVNAISGTTTLTTGVWYHIAVCRTGTSTKMYLNGVQEGSTYTDTTNYIVGNPGPTIFAEGSNLYAWNGYGSNVRIVKGVCVYTGNFTPSTSPLTATQPAGTNISAITGTATSLLLNTVSGAYLADGSVNAYSPGTVTGTPAWNQLSPFATGLGYKNRVYTWASSSGTITF